MRTVAVAAAAASQARTASLAVPADSVPYNSGMHRCKRLNPECQPQTLRTATQFQCCKWNSLQTEGSVRVVQELCRPALLHCHRKAALAESARLNTAAAILHKDARRGHCLLKDACCFHTDQPFVSDPFDGK